MTTIQRIIVSFLILGYLLLGITAAAMLLDRCDKPQTQGVK